MAAKKKVTKRKTNPAFRPPKSIRVYASADEEAAIKAAAERDGRAVSNWLLRAAAEKIARDGAA